MSEEKKTAEKPSTPSSLGAQEDKKVGQILLEMKHITADQLADAMAVQQQLNTQGKRVFKIGEVLLFRKFITLHQLHAALRSQTAKAELSRISIIQSKKKIEDEKTAIKLKKKAKKDEKTEGSLSSIFSFLKKKE